jgi:hypothetical protein
MMASVIFEVPSVYEMTSFCQPYLFVAESVNIDDE